VQPFTGTSDTLRLIEAWPADAPLPGAAAANPAHDTIWIYDFKQTPGYRVRVTGIEPESDLKGAKVSVVPEPPEFWNYVLTGEYVPPVNNNPGLTRPVASGLAVTEQQVVQGDTVFTELTVTFEVSGPVGNVVVLAAGSDGVLAEVAQTSTRTATWRISQADQYTVVVRPFSPGGQVGVSASVTYVTAGADVPPLLVDYFEVDELPGGVRMYTWGFLSETIQSPDFAGVEVRHMAGQVAEPDWEAMTPIGEGGYHTVPFEAVVPKAGAWTFACRSRNTSGELSTGMRVVTKSLGQNLGEQLQETWEEAERANQRLGQEIIDRLAGDLEAINEATAKAREYTDAQVAALNGILEDIVGADEWTAEGNYPQGDFVQYGGTLFRALQPSTGVQPGTDPAIWQEIGDYTSVGDALAASIRMGTQNATDISAQAGRIDAVVVKLPSDGGQAASSGQVATQVNALAEADRVLAERVDTTNAELAGKASNARVNSVEQASVSRDDALADQISTTNAALDAKASTDTVQQLESKVSAQEGKLEATSQAVTQVRASLAGGANMLKDGGFSRGFTYWSQPFGSAIYYEPKYGNYLAVNPIAGGVASEQVVRTEAGIYVFSAEVFRNSGTGNVRVEVGAYSAQGFIGSASALSDPTKLRQWQQVFAAINAPVGTTYLVCRLIFEATDVINSVRRGKLELGLTPTLWTDDTAVDITASATQALAVRATQLENGQSVLMAQYNVVLDVNGRIVGQRAVNDGRVGRWDFVADIFSITDPNNTGSTTFEQGRWITRSGGFMLAHGKPFGTTGDLMMWLGIGSDPAAASKANALFWIDNRGNGYFGGSLRAGAINSGGQYNLNESNWNSATFMSATHKGSLGRPKTVMRWARLSSGIISGGNSPQPARTGILRLRLWRGPTLLSEQNITATSQNVYTADDNTTRTYTTWEWPQLSLTDTSSEAGDIPYRMQIEVVGGNYYGTPGQAIGVEANLAVLSIVES